MDKTSSGLFSYCTAYTSHRYQGRWSVRHRQCRFRFVTKDLFNSLSTILAAPPNAPHSLPRRPSQNFHLPLFSHSILSFYFSPLSRLPLPLNTSNAYLTSYKASFYEIHSTCSRRKLRSPFPSAGVFLNAGYLFLLKNGRSLQGTPSKPSPSFRRVKRLRVLP